MTNHGYGIISNGGIVDLDTIRKLPFNAEVVGVLVKWCDLMNNKRRQIDKLEAEIDKFNAIIRNGEETIAELTNNNTNGKAHCDVLRTENTALRATIANTLGFPKGGKC